MDPRWATYVTMTVFLSALSQAPSLNFPLQPWWFFSSRTQQTTMWGWKLVAWFDIWAPRTRNRWMDANSPMETTSSFVCGMWTAPGTTSLEVSKFTPWRLILVWISMSGRFRITPAGYGMTSKSRGGLMPDPNCRHQPMRNQIARNGKGKWEQELVERAAAAAAAAEQFSAIFAILGCIQKATAPHMTHILSLQSVKTVKIYFWSCHNTIQWCHHCTMIQCAWFSNFHVNISHHFKNILHVVFQRGVSSLYCGDDCHRSW